MAQNYIRTLFTDAARAMQDQAGSRSAFYIASVTADGWPYVQHRGGSAGFLKLLDGNRVAFADYPGNKQYISTSNLQAEPRVSLFLMDYPNRRRLKILGKANIVEPDEDPALLASLINPEDKAVAERIYVIDVIGFDWNCPQYITPRFTEAEIAAAVGPLTAELEQLRSEVAQLRATKDSLKSERGE